MASYSFSLSVLQYLSFEKKHIKQSKNLTGILFLLVFRFGSTYHLEKSILNNH